MGLIVNRLDQLLTLSRPTGAMRTNKDGRLEMVPAGKMRFDFDPVTKLPLGVLVEEGATNVCLNRNFNPTDLTGMTKVGDPAATLTLVNDAAALAASGLDGICSNGMVYKLDNSQGTGVAGVRISGVSVINLPYAISVYSRGGIAYVGFVTSSGSTVGGSKQSVASPSTYVRTTHLLSGAAASIMGVRCVAGSVIYFILNQLEVGDVASSTIPTNAAATTRSADLLEVGGYASREWFDPTAWTVMADVRVRQLNKPQSIFTAPDGPYVRLRADNRLAAGLTRFADAIVTPGGIALGRNRIAAAYGAGEYALSLNGGVVQKANPFAGTGMTPDAGPSLAFAGHLLRIAHFRGRRTDAQLMTLATQ